VQEYINHGGVMVKTYFLNETNKSVTRPSLPNIDESIIEEMPHFKKGYFEFYNEFLYQKQDQTFWERVKVNENLEKEIDYGLLNEASLKFNEFSNISLYGLDFMFDEVTKLYYLLEINYFPSYREFGLELYKLITEHILKCYKKFKK
jgi:hypothetical protein